MDDDRLPISDSAAAWLAGGGEMGDRIRRLDWTGTPAGPTATWPQSLRSAVSILLPSKAQICLFWGRDLIKLYNDAYIPVLDRKHPWALGRPAREVWSEIWDVLGPLLEGVVATGEAFRAGDHPFYLERRGFAEETYFDVSYDPVRDESGKVGGVFCIVSETTGRVLSERRLRTLRDLGRAKEGRSVSEACELALAALGSNPKDLPFVSLYLVGRRRRARRRRRGRHGRRRAPPPVDRARRCPLVPRRGHAERSGARPRHASRGRRRRAASGRRAARHAGPARCSGEASASRS